MGGLEVQTKKTSVKGIQMDMVGMAQIPLHLLQLRNTNSTNKFLQLVNFNTVVKVIWITGTVIILDLDRPERY